MSLRQARLLLVLSIVCNLFGGIFSHHEATSASRCRNTCWIILISCWRLTLYPVRRHASLIVIIYSLEHLWTIITCPASTAHSTTSFRRPCPNSDVAKLKVTPERKILSANKGTALLAARPSIRHICETGLARMLPGKVPTWPLKKFFEKGRGQCHVTT